MFSWQHVVIVLLIVVILFGAKKLPQIGKGMGEAIKNFKASSNNSNDEEIIDITPQSDAKSDKEKKNSKEH